MKNRGSRSALKSFTKAVRHSLRAVLYGRASEIIGILSEKNRNVYRRHGSMMGLKGVRKRIVTLWSKLRGGSATETLVFIWAIHGRTEYPIVAA